MDIPAGVDRLILDRLRDVAIASGRSGEEKLSLDLGLGPEYLCHCRLRLGYIPNRNLARVLLALCLQWDVITPAELYGA